MQQDLWVAYLSGKNLISTLDEIVISDTLYEKSKTITSILLEIPNDIKDFLTEQEKFLLCLLLMGYDIDSVSMYNGISTVHNKQMLSSLSGSTYLKSLV